jgi:antirestriction protein ArdC
MNHDLYQETTNRIVSAIESGNTLPWVKPWSLGDMRPRNAVTQRVYRGINNLLLGLAADAKGYDQTRWLTFRQATELGAHVRSGEDGIRVVFYKLQEFSEAGTQTTETRSFPLLRCFTVFNVCQIGGLPPEYTDVQRPAAWDGHLCVFRTKVTEDSDRT